MLIGNDSLRFEVIHNFGNLPEHTKLGYTHGVCVDIDDNVYVFNQSENAVIKFDRHGKFELAWGSVFAGGAHGMRLTREGRHQFLYLADHDLHVVVKYSLRGDEQLRLGVPPRKDIYATMEEFKPTDVCVSPDGNIYVFDGYGKPYVHMYDRHGKLLKSIGGPGNGPGQLNCPHGGWVDTRKPEPELYVADRGNNRIQVFTVDGTFKRIIQHQQLEKPCGFYQYKDELWIPDLQAKVVVLDGHDKIKAILGDNPQAPTTPGWPNIQDKLIPGQSNSPHACCVDAYGDVYVVEWISTGRITKLVRKSW